MRRKPRIVPVLFVTAIWLIFVIAGLVISYKAGPQVQIQRLAAGAVPATDGKDLTLTMQMVFNASGSFSATNPVTVRGIFTNQTFPSDFLSQYCCVAFTNSQNVPPLKFNSFINSIGVTRMFAGTGSGSQAWCEKGEYCIDTTLQWQVEGDSWLFFVAGNTVGPQTPVKGTDFEKGMPIVTISSIQDKNTQTFNNLATSLTVIVIGFSALALYPLVKDLWEP